MVRVYVHEKEGKFHWNYFFLNHFIRGEKPQMFSCDIYHKMIAIIGSDPLNCNLRIHPRNLASYGTFLSTFYVYQFIYMGFKWIPRSGLPNEIHCLQLMLSKRLSTAVNLCFLLFFTISANISHLGMKCVLFSATNCSFHYF